MTTSVNRGVIKTAPIGRINLVMDGNSLTASGYFPQLVYTDLVSLGYTVMMQNYGVGGQTTEQMLADDRTVDIAENLNAYKNIIHVWEGSNELYFNATAITTYNNIVTYCKRRRAAGFQVIVGTLTPRIFTLTPVTQEADRLAVNANIRSNWRSFADGISDMGADPIVGNYDYCLNTAYFADGVHYTAAGYTIVADIVSKAIRKLV